MTKKIKELAERATHKVLGVPQLDTVTFAELIIEEAIGVMKSADYHGEWLGEQIKKHFELT